jgi:hypothetical protein
MLVTQEPSSQSTVNQVRTLLGRVRLSDNPQHS